MDSLDHRDHKDYRVLRVLPALTVRLVLPVQLELQDFQVRLDFRVGLDLLELLDRLVHLAGKEFKELRELLGQQGFADQLDRSVLPDYPDLLDSPVRRGSLVLREILDSRDQLERLERRGSVDLLVFQEASAERVSQAILVLLAP